FSRRHRPDFAKTDLGHHPLKSSADDRASRGATEIVIDHLDLAPTEFAQSVAHGVLQFLALLIVHHLVRRGLTNVQKCLAVEMMSVDLIAHPRVLLLPGCWPSGCAARAACVPSGASLSRVPPRAVGAIPVLRCREETVLVVGYDEGVRRVASASPSREKERGPASIITPAVAPKAPRIKAFSLSRAARFTRGDSARAMPQHAARSNIHSGIARRRSVTSVVSEHRNRRVSPLTNISWTQTRRPNHGCQG